MKPISIALMAGLAMLPTAAFGEVVARFPMDVRYGQIQESVSGNRFAVEGHFAPENLPGAAGQALRFDGYTSFIDASLGNILPAGNKQMTFSLWAALPCYPIVEIDRNTKEKVAIASCLDEEAKTGFGFYVGFNGEWQFRAYIGGWPVEVNVQTPLPVYQWNHLAAVVDCDARTVTVYNNGEAVGQTRCSGEITFGGGRLLIGHGTLRNFSGPFLLSSYNGLIDEIEVRNTPLSKEELLAMKPENPADLDIPDSRFAGDILRPRFHGMPAAAWTNECHGMTFSDGRYHLFFQKNANGPYMARLHWGHISSANLYDWREEPIAIAPGASYDIKGCWSGCVFSDKEITGDLPAAIYTGVDYGHASIDAASPTDATLLKWNKWGSNPLISGRPQGLSDDFRDPYFFRNGANAYIIVGSSSGGVGCTTLHRYNPSTKSWSNNGDLFFRGNTANNEGSFWEMPNITPMGDGRWLFTATPLGLASGVRSIYWTGTIREDGTFQPDANSSAPKNIELTAKEGFGLLSPTIYRHDGQTIALGIVPDKLSGQDNWNLGWAHCYSLPRLWSLDDKGSLVQKPHPSLEGLRTSTSFSRNDFQLQGNLELAPVEGREAEICGVFTIGNSPFGLKIFKNATAEATITYNPTSSSLKLDFSKLKRLINDGGVYDGVYTLTMPEFLRRGSELKINVFIDHSIVDIFINDRWATSIRVFPTDADANGIEAFSSTGTTSVKSLQAWKLDKGSTGINTPVAGEAAAVGGDVYNLQGMLLQRAADATALRQLPSGLYIVGGKLVKL